MATPAASASRAARLAKFFDSVTRGVQPLKTIQNGNLFIEALCVQPDPPSCIDKVVSSPAGMSAIQTAVRFDDSAGFQNGPATSLLRYLQAPALKTIYAGKYLHLIILNLVDPPFFWNSFLLSFRNGLLDLDAQHCFGWLLCELLGLPNGSGLSYLAIAQDSSINATFQNSTSFEIRTVGQKLKHVASAFNSPSEDDSESGPGGRHDNDFVDFREIAIHPTADEILSEEPPFLRVAEALDTPGNEERRLALHLDSQYRLLREDMLSEMRDELQVVLGKKKGRHRGVVVNGFTLHGDEYGDHKNRKPLRWGLRLQSTSDLPQLAKTKPKERRDFFVVNRNIFKHQSLACLIIDGEIVSFPTIHRDLDQLTQKLPIVTLQFTGKASTLKTLLRLKTAQHIRLVQVDTAVFAFEPVLKGLQGLRNMPLVDELLFWRSGSTISQPPHAPVALISRLEGNPTQDLRYVFDLTKSVRLDDSQLTSLLTGLRQRVSLIQGPPGTGKSFIGALIAKAIYQFTEKVVLVVCFKNHALDQFLEDLLDIGIPADQMVRLGGQSTPKTKCMALYDQPAIQPGLPRRTLDELRGKSDALASRMHDSFARYQSVNVRQAELMEYLEFLPQGAEFYEAFSVPEANNGSTRIGGKGKAINKFYLLDQWSGGRDAGILCGQVPETSQCVWQMPVAARQACLWTWKQDILKEQVLELQIIADQYNASLGEIDEILKRKNAQVIGSKRIVAATTTAAAKYVQELQAASRDVILVEEAGEILESHILTAMGPQTRQLVLIGDHKQLRPRVSHDLSVEKGEGYDLNRSLFERLVLKGFPHQTLIQQHRMRPTISALVRSLTYPDLVDASKTEGRPNIRGLQDNLIFISHHHPEVDAKEAANWKEMSSISSKQNIFEVDMVLRCVKYLAQQGYGTDDIVVLTPYLGQLHLLRTVLSKENDPVLNDLDSFELVRAGLMPAGSAKVSQRKIRLATIDNYQGEESDIVVASLTRSNAVGDIGFMAFPQRLNVLLSRARNGLVLIGNVETFLNARKGKEIWTQLFDLLKQDGHIYEGLPVKCERHSDTTTLLREPANFEDECADGGCNEPCGTTLNCGLHLCPQKCHQLHDHSMVPCEYVLRDKCLKGHSKSWKCHKPPPKTCSKCEAGARRAQKEMQLALKLQEKRDRDEQDYFRHMAELDEMLSDERQRLRETQLLHERARVLEQKEQDLARARDLTAKILNPPPQPAPAHPDSVINDLPTPQDPRKATQSSMKQPDQGQIIAPSAALEETGGPKWKGKQDSPAKKEWERQKNMENASNDAIDAIMEMTGLEEVKIQILRIKAKVDVSVRQNSDMKEDRLNVVFMGNPGTGKTTVARLYAKILTSLGAIPGSAFMETTGSRLANDGVTGIKKLIEEIHNAGGGAVFLDEAYQLSENHNYGGKQVLDFLLAEMENNVGKIVFILAGYNKEMEKFFEHNPGLMSRVPYTLQFTDYQDDELLWMLQRRIEKRYSHQMRIAGGKDGLYMRIVARRLGRGRGRPGFGNARTLHTTFSTISERQAERLTRERKDGPSPDDFFLSKEDLIGPDPSKAILTSIAWEKMQELTGLRAVKESIKGMIDRVNVNYERELKEKAPIQVSLNRVFLGSPGTGKTSVAKLYGQILADLGLLSNGEVAIKNPADFIGSALGQSESNTKAILATTVGKVLIIDEAYMLHSSNAGGPGNQSDTYKTAVIDTIVAEIQSVPGEDRCVLLLGYEDEIRTMFQNVNPGLSRRFAIESAFYFENFTDGELLEILGLKLKQQDLEATNEAKTVAIEVLSRARNRPNFGNAGEVENLLSLAKGRYQTRQPIEPSQGSFDVIFEPQDFDPDFKRGEHASTNLQKLFADVVGCEEIIEKLDGYQQVARNMKTHGRQSRGLIPTNFLFKGPPGTGKTTTARKMGQVFFDLGFLSVVEVVECSASDLIGSYVGHTGPKTRAQLEKALGKVLFVDEAYRLAEGHFATEAINELVDLLTKPTFMDKIVVILAGYDKDINNLITVNPGLSSRFPEQIVFRDMSPEHCLQVLERTIKEQEIETPALTDPQSQIHKDMAELIKELASLPSWGNARDIKTLAKTMIGSVFKAKTLPTDALAVSAEEVINVSKAMFQERRDRSQNLPPTIKDGLHEGLPKQLHAPERAPDLPELSIARSEEKMASPKQKPAPLFPVEDEEIHRDNGVADDVWMQLQADIQAAKAEFKVSDEDFRREEEAFSTAVAKEREDIAEVQELEKAKAKDEAGIQELKRKQEEARLQEQAARIAREKAVAELERMRLQKAKQKREELVQVKLRQMGVCCAGYQWIKQSSGYRCAGGSHYISNGQLGL